MLRNRFLLLLGVFVVLAVASFYFIKQTRQFDIQKLCVTHDGKGIHTHANLSIVIKNKPVTIPADIGIDRAKNCMHPIHTHDDSGIIHMEIPSHKDFTLEEFFRMWGKRFDSKCIFDNCGKITMKVNGKNNNSFENYILHDQDQIEIRYE